MPGAGMQAGMELGPRVGASTRVLGPLAAQPVPPARTVTARQPTLQLLGPPFSFPPQQKHKQRITAGHLHVAFGHAQAVSQRLERRRGLRVAGGPWPHHALTQLRQPGVGEPAVVRAVAGSPHKHRSLTADVGDVQLLAQAVPAPWGKGGGVERGNGLCSSERQGRSAWPGPFRRTAKGTGAHALVHLGATPRVGQLVPWHPAIPHSISPRQWDRLQAHTAPLEKARQVRQPLRVHIQVHGRLGSCGVGEPGTGVGCQGAAGCGCDAGLWPGRGRARTKPDTHASPKTRPAHLQVSGG